MNYAPHILKVCHPGQSSTDDEDVTTIGDPTWETIGECRCDDNGGLKQIGINGQSYTYNYHIVYEGPKLPIRTKVRVFEADSTIRGEGEVIKSSKCNFFNYSEIWL
ncbi:hypothetical protein [uncultured Bacteroides sp.]|uniref:hypothetical protein n=1 Tax=uncultured Bacteroides sp. TaxID=162156 RepID=UPI002AAC2267|nr:hypothetical protein [uncultured Bacteroides sp.]